MNTASLLRAGAVTLLLVVSGQTLAGETGHDVGEPADRTNFELPSFDAMLSAAMSHNPDVRTAESQVDMAKAEAGRVRLQVAQEIRQFRNEWNEELAALAAAKAEMRDAERMATLPESAVAGRVVLQSERLVETSRQRVELAKNRLLELQQVLPLLLGTTIDEDAAPTEQPASTESADAGPEELDDVLRQRLEVLIKIAELRWTAYESGEAQFDAASAAQADVLEARLELARSRAERIEILRELLDVARALEEVAGQQSRAQVAGVVDVLKARAFRLRCQADLLREQSGR